METREDGALLTKEPEHGALPVGNTHTVAVLSMEHASAANKELCGPLQRLRTNVVLESGNSTARC